MCLFVLFGNIFVWIYFDLRYTFLNILCLQAKKFVESCPTVVKADIPKDEAEKLKEALSAVGAECVIE